MLQVRTTTASFTQLVQDAAADIYDEVEALAANQSFTKIHCSKACEAVAQAFHTEYFREVRFTSLTRCVVAEMNAIQIVSQGAPVALGDDPTQFKSHSRAEIFVFQEGESTLKRFLFAVIIPVLRLGNIEMKAFDERNANIAKQMNWTEGSITIISSIARLKATGDGKLVSMIVGVGRE